MAFFGFRVACKDAVGGCVKRYPVDGGGAGLKVKVGKLKATQFFPSVAAKDGKSKKNLISKRGFFHKDVQEGLGLLYVIALLFLLAHGWSCDSGAWIIFEHTHLHGIRKNPGNEAKIILDSFWGEAFALISLVYPRLSERIDERLDLSGRDLVQI